MTQNRYAQGVDARADVVAAEAQLKTAQAQAIDFTLQRAQLEHAIAVLLGQPPGRFLPPARGPDDPPPASARLDSLATAGAPARHRRRGAPAGRGLRADRGGQGRLFPGYFALRFRRLSGRSLPEPVHGAERNLVGRRRGGGAPVRGRQGPRPSPAGPRRLRRKLGHLPADRPRRLSGGGGQPRRRRLLAREERCRTRRWRPRANPRPSRSTNTRPAP